MSAKPAHGRTHINPVKHNTAAHISVAPLRAPALMRRSACSPTLSWHVLGATTHQRRAGHRQPTPTSPRHSSSSCQLRAAPVAHSGPPTRHSIGTEQPATNRQWIWSLTRRERSPLQYRPSALAKMAETTHTRERHISRLHAPDSSMSVSRHGHRCPPLPPQLLAALRLPSHPNARRHPRASCPMGGAWPRASWPASRRRSSS